MKRITLAAAVLSFTSLASAAPAPVAKSLTSLETSLHALEKTVAEVERRKTVSGDFDLDAALEAYAQQALEAFRETYDGVGAQAKAGSRDAATARAALQRFETTAAAHAKRTHALVLRLSDLTRGMRTGAVSLSPDYLRKLDDEEIAGLRDFLSPETRQRYESVEPRLRAPGNGSARLAPLVGLDDAPERAELRCAADAWRAQRRASRSWAEQLGDFVMPPAEAALGLGCVAICEASLGTACASCVGAGSVAAVALYKGAVEAFNSCNRFRPTPRFLCKAAVVAAFIAALA